LADVLRLHGGGRSVVFAETKRQVEELGEVLRKYDTAAGTLHGDMTQGLREATLAAFRKGELPCVVATDVAARGLDVPNVDLVVQYEPPSKTESFLHRRYV
jgi:superfamily II DNA/RNA helicase